MKRKPLIAALQALAQEYEARAATFDNIAATLFLTQGANPICKASADAYRECARLLTKTLKGDQDEQP